MSLFGKSHKEHERDIREEIALNRNITISKVLHVLISREKHHTHPHTTIGRDEAKKVADRIEEIRHKKPEELPLYVYFHNHRLFIQDNESRIRLRAYRSSGKRYVKLKLQK